MAGPSRTTPGHYGGSGFDPLSSPSRQDVPHQDTAPEVSAPVTVPGTESWGAILVKGLIGAGLLVGGLAFKRWVEGDDEDD